MGRCQQSIEGTIEHRPPIKCQLTANEGGGVGGGIYKRIGTYPPIIYASTPPLSTRQCCMLCNRKLCSRRFDLDHGPYTESVFPSGVKSGTAFSLATQIIYRHLICPYSLPKRVLIWRLVRRTNAKPIQLPLNYCKKTETKYVLQASSEQLSAGIKLVVIYFFLNKTNSLVAVPKHAIVLRAFFKSYPQTSRSSGDAKVSLSHTFYQ